MSEVFHGYDERLDRRVAIKILRPTHSRSVPAAPDSPEAAEILDALERDRKRFLREIRTTAQLEHPGTPAVYDTGVETAAEEGAAEAAAGTFLGMGPVGWAILAAVVVVVVVKVHVQLTLTLVAPATVAVRLST